MSFRRENYFVLWLVWLDVLSVVGDPDSGLAAGTRFEDIPDDWMCPICGVGKADFELCVPAKPRRERIIAAAVSRNTKPLVIAGAGIAGWTVAQALRDKGYEAEIVMVSACSADRHHKPQLSVAFAQRKSPEHLVIESSATAAFRLKVTLLRERFITNITTGTNTLRTSHGVVPYSQLVLSIGAQPKKIQADWAKHCWQINHLADC